MKCGVLYKFNTGNKLNGSLFYCFEYFKFLSKHTDVKFYIADISDADLDLVINILSQKYNTTFDNIVSVKTINLYNLKLDKTLVLDIRTFYACKEFLTGDVHCFSNEAHSMFRYKNSRTVNYYGSYDYQNFDTFCYLKLNFEIFKSFDTCTPGVFVSTVLNSKYLEDHLSKYEQRFQRPVYLKKHFNGFGNLFEMIDAVHYVHTCLDTNNRIIPEAFYYNKSVTIEEPLYAKLDSIMLRYNDIKDNGLENYTLSLDDEMIKAMLK
jgi:hypothetical protein